MSIKITYFVHGTTTDNENNRATGHAPGELSELGVQQAKELGEKVDEEFDAVYSSDLKRAVESAKLAFGDEYDIIEDERLRECDYGEMTQDEFNWDLTNYIENPYPGGESYKDIEKRIRGFLKEVEEKHEGEHIAIVAHQAPQLALEVLSKGKTWEEAIETDWREVGEWQPGWKYYPTKKDIVISVTYNPEIDKYLIVRRSEQKSNTGEWEFPSGKIEEGETPRDAAKRENQEEIDLEGKITKEGEKVIEEDYRFHPFKVELHETDVELSWEHDKYQWKDRNEIPNPKTADNMGKMLKAIEK